MLRELHESAALLRELQTAGAAVALDRVGWVQDIAAPWAEFGPAATDDKLGTSMDPVRTTQLRSRRIEHIAEGAVG